MQSNGEYAPSWTWEEPETINDKAESPYCIPLQFCYNIRKDSELPIPKNIIILQTAGIEESVQLVPFDLDWSP